MTRLEPETSGFHTDEPRIGIDETGEGPDRVRSSADARDDYVGIRATEQLTALPVRFVAHDPLELPHHPRERMRTHGRAQAVVRALDARDPRAHRFVHRVLQRRAARLHRHYLRAEQLHAPDVERLPFDVDRTHVDG